MTFAVSSQLVLSQAPEGPLAGYFASFANSLSALGYGPTHKLASTSTGATNSATCTLEPMAMASDRSMRFLIAALMAMACSAALPRMATTKTPTKTLLKPNSCAVGSIAPTSISLTQAMAAVAAARMSSDFCSDHGGGVSPAATCATEPTNSALCVINENTRNSP